MSLQKHYPDIHRAFVAQPTMIDKVITNVLLLKSKGLLKPLLADLREKGHYSLCENDLDRIAAYVVINTIISDDLNVDGMLPFVKNPGDGTLRSLLTNIQEECKDIEDSKLEAMRKRFGDLYACFY